MSTQVESPQQTNSLNPPTVPMQNIARCEECGDVDDDTRSGTVICRRCADDALATVAHTD